MTEAVLSGHGEQSLLHLVNLPLVFPTADFGTQFKPENFKSSPLEKGEKRALCNSFTGAIYLRPDQHDKWQECPTIEIAIKGMQSVIDNKPKKTSEHEALLDLLYYSRDVQRYTLENVLEELNKFTEDPTYIANAGRRDLDYKVDNLEEIITKLIDPNVIKTNPYRRAGLLSKVILFGLGEEDYQKRMIKKLSGNEELFKVIDRQKSINIEFHEDFNNFQTDELKGMLSDRIQASQILITTALDKGAKDFFERREPIPYMGPES